MSDQSARWVDASQLPEELVALIDTLRPGEDVLITRNGETIATISAAVREEPVEHDPAAGGTAGPDHDPAEPAHR